MIRERFFFRETIATILADEAAHIAAAKRGILCARQVLEKYIARDPFFLTTFDPYVPDSDDPVIRRMADAGQKASVGPMAAVAGTIAWAGIDAMVEEGAEFGVIDNGGDIALINASRPVRVGIHAGTSPLSNRFAFFIPPKKEISGICTSSATVGPSISFGVADSVTVFSKNPALADAWATAVCNRIRTDDTSVFSDLDPEKITGVFAVLGDYTERWGDIPPIVPAVVDEHLISAGDRL
ncbi:MAG TPA: UPF0280 family protein [Methanoregulaceae archaeon]|nr:UPF0280 family protein [Methanoregulaceae archaeon]HPD75498.1 UPF0280 family protein [Methanoregulaceae archaeon]